MTWINFNVVGLDYQNEAIIRGLPTHIFYSFSVIVYDKELDSWSPESATYEYIPAELGNFTAQVYASRYMNV